LVQLTLERESGQGQQLHIGCGTAMPESRLLIVDPESRTPCAEGSVGEIWLSGPHVAQGYWRRPEQTQETFHARLADSEEGPFLRTGDLGLVREGELFVMGRIKDLLIIRGVNHYPQDIELTVERAHRGVRPGCVAAFCAEMEGEEALVVAAELERGQEQQAEDIAQVLREAIVAEHELSPRAVVLLARGTIPKTSSGKIQRHAARREFLQGTLESVLEWRAKQVRPPAAAVAEPRPAVAEPRPAVAEQEATLRAWLVDWVARHAGLPSEHVSLHQPFTHYGLESKDAVALSGELEEVLGRRVAPTVAYDHGSILKLAAHLAGRQEQVRKDSAPREEEPIAIIGLGCRVPGAAGPEAFWRLLSEGVDASAEIPPERWEVEAYHSPHSSAGVMASRRAALLEGIGLFDASLFSISEREARSMDPQHRLLLEVAWEALESAGLAPSSLSGTQTGVFVGISNNDYGRLGSSGARGQDAWWGTGNAFSTAAGRVSYVLGLQGPCMAVDTACSSSLVSVHLACQSLRQRESHVALAGGVNVILSPEGSIYLSTLNALSADGRCKTFDASADGYGRGEGCGLLVLKRLTDAVADGDTVLAVIRGSAVNQDGASNGLTAPNGQAQQAVIRAALERAGVKPHQVSYVEAHGTGTRLGDPIELGALGAVLGEGRSPQQPVKVGSVKTNVGHLESAAGVVGLIKVVLSLEHQALPPHLHLKTPSPYIPWKELPVEVPTRLTPWEGAQRVAGVSSFGLSGTNAHVILEQAPQHERAHASLTRPRHPIVLSARDESALTELAGRYAAQLRSLPQLAAGDIAASASQGRAHLPHRLAITVTSTEDAAGKLAAFADGQPQAGIVSGVVPLAARVRPVFLFTGQGSQYAGMGHDLYESAPVFRETLDRCANLLGPYLERGLLEIVFAEPGSPEADLLNRTEYTQPALFAVEDALAMLWQSWGMRPAAVAGHSLGEYVAACVAGVFSLQDALRLVAA
ncbi:MAG TPA: beta-ketoacyl synthase N-terminal-like domain-containing protein, partial [Myxococcaceae bacterium]|nr:beta-ketoacyl synthase N-terminal-like domain-containing protein [Myxococcaceae bacterium]